MSAADNTMRAEFEAFMTRTLKIPTHRRESGGYTAADVRTCWHVWQAARAGTARMVADAVAAERGPLIDGYVSGSAVSDFAGAKVTLRYETSAQAEAAFIAITDQIDASIRDRATTPDAGEQR